MVIHFLASSCPSYGVDPFGTAQRQCKESLARAHERISSQTVVFSPLAAVVPSSSHPDGVSVGLDSDCAPLDGLPG